MTREQVFTAFEKTLKDIVNDSQRCWFVVGAHDMALECLKFFPTSAELSQDAKRLDDIRIKVFSDVD